MREDYYAGSEKYFADLEDQNTKACWDCATNNGHSKEEADNCDDGSVGCPNCPFNGRKEKGI